MPRLTGSFGQLYLDLGATEHHFATEICEADRRVSALLDSYASCLDQPLDIRSYFVLSHCLEQAVCGETVELVFSHLSGCRAAQDGGDRPLAESVFEPGDTAQYFLNYDYFCLAQAAQ